MDLLVKTICLLVEKAAPVCIGACLAFYFGFRLYKKQKREESRVYLNYGISILSSLSNNLYTFKEQIAQPRYDEVVKLRNKLKNPDPVNGVLNLQCIEVAKYIYGADFESDISMEKLAFLSNRDPNLIILLGTLINSVKSLNHIIEDMNNEISEYSKKMEAPIEQKIMILLKKNELLYEQLDSTMYLNEKSMSLMIRFGELEYKKEMKIKSSVVVEEKYKNLKPKPIDSWEGDYEWFPKKKTLFSRIISWLSEACKS